MREILFRGKDVISGEWVYGDLAQEKHTDNSIKCAIVQTLSTYEVTPSTVGQYTGLVDKNGKKIFEGDIVSYIIVTGGIEDLSIPANVRHTVTYDEKHGAFRIGYHYFCGGTMREVVDANNLVVIGNIHDNHELLKGGKE